MYSWMNLKVKTKCLVLVALAVVTMAALVAGGLLKMQGMARSEEDMSAAVRHVGLLNDLKGHLFSMRLDVARILLVKDRSKVEELAQDLEVQRSKIVDGIAEFKKSELEPKEKDLIDIFAAGSEAYHAEAVKLSRTVAGHLGDPAKREEDLAYATRNITPLSEKPTKAIVELVQYNIDAAAATYRSDLSGYHSSITWTVAIGAAAALLLCALGVLIANSISRPLRSVFGTLTEVAAGDLTARSSITTRDEMGMLAGEVNQMAQTLMGLMQRVASNSRAVASAASDLHDTSEVISNGADEVACQTGTVATATEEMAATSGDIAQNCHLAAVEGKGATASAEAGAAVVKETVQVMSRIATRVKASAATVASLGQRSDQIGEIVGTIEDIADQTNLLALNAAIEAARAGEQGRGFAVVADEVRALAERTTKATREIGEMIRSIQAETRDAVQAMEEGVHEVGAGTVEAEKSGASLQEILEKVSGVTLQIAQIATAAEQQTATTAEISSNITQITGVVQRTSSGAHHCAGAASDLATLAEDLQSLVGKFKLA
ncbi:methyl-accepting chemotaxis protein [Geomonas sp. RF6]|uniref:methyl-accepting chemotaxis protein n=1 Tax=Geomonas sp. RF6 TaxID=2897342 RepID=UPI001E58BBEA|nr:methyl-accepting chemotaxis protein [Geomonas sp. RF6]UFS70106.1 methyl-accepting chemotaxis protein [Geomonas sp. RF6]